MLKSGLCFLTFRLGLRNPLALSSFGAVDFEILIFLQPNGNRSEEQRPNTDGRITQLLPIPTNSKINF